MISIDSSPEGGKLFLNQHEKKYEAQIVGLIGKMGAMAFTQRKILEDFETFGKSSITTKENYTALLNEMMRVDP